MFGLLNIYKPAGVTSRDVVNHVQRLVRPAKAGHGGTLDPLAEGVLIVCVGKATRLIEYVQQTPKEYCGVFQLGQTSNTLDIEGEVSSLDNPPVPTRGQIEEALLHFVGEIDQIPPAFSALKIGGKRAYDLARRGQHVDLPPRKVCVYHLELLDYEYPQMTLKLICGRGTYVRSLGRDVAQAVGTAAVMSALKRLAIGDFRVEQACSMEQLGRNTMAGFLQSPRQAVGRLPSIRLTQAQLERIRKGQTIRPHITDVIDGASVKSDEIAAFDESGKLAAILAPCGPPNSSAWRPRRNFIAG